MGGTDATDTDQAEKKQQLGRGRPRKQEVTVAKRSGAIRGTKLGRGRPRKLAATFTERLSVEDIVLSSLVVGSGLAITLMWFRAPLQDDCKQSLRDRLSA